MFFILPFAYAEGIQDYNNPYAPIFFDKPVYTWTDKIKITIVAPSWNSDRDLIDSIGDDQENPIKISTRSHSLEPYRLTETGVTSGIFTGEVILTGFLHDADGDGDFDTMPRTFGNGPTSGFLEVERDSAITVSFEFADGVVLTESVPVSWNMGTIRFSDDNFLIDNSAIIEVIDPDMNLNPEGLDQLTLDVSSDSDIAGIDVSAIETGESTGRFVATISFTPTQTSSGNRLHAVPGDDIFAKYDDYTLPKPATISDNKQIISQSRVDSSTPSIERLTNNKIMTTDSLGNSLNSYSINNQFQIVGSVTNQQPYHQEFAFLFQIKDDQGVVISISWIIGQISPNQTLDVSQSWMPKKSGQYFIETFVWESLGDASPLSQPLSTSIFVE